MKVYAATVQLEITYLIAASDIDKVSSLAKERFLYETTDSNLSNGIVSVPAIEEALAIEPDPKDHDSLSSMHAEATKEAYRQVLALKSRKRPTKKRKRS